MMCVPWSPLFAVDAVSAMVPPIAWRTSAKKSQVMKVREIAFGEIRACRMS